MSQTAKEAPPLKARHFRFDFSQTPLHWIPDDPYATHLINVLHMIAPVGERRFIKAVQAVQHRIHDERLKADIKGFIGQEAAHAHVHDAVLTRLKELGIDSEEYLRVYEQVYDFFTFQNTPFPDEWFLTWRVASTAAAEQITCVLGDWVLEADGLDASGADRMMLEFLRWHGAEEVEHRSVAFDTLKEVAGPAEYPIRVAAMLTVFPVMWGLWVYGTQYYLRQDPTLKGRRFTFQDLVASVKADHCPGWELVHAALRYLGPTFHPSQESCLEKAQAFFAGWSGPPRAA
jgi:hypothetical protein